MAYIKILKAESRFVRQVYYIDGAVGQGRANKRDDVMLVQFFLKAASKRIETVTGESYQPRGQPEIQVDGVCGATTIAFIRHFQGITDRLAQNAQLRPWQDGAVDAVPQGVMFGNIHGGVYTMISLNITYSSLYGKTHRQSIYTRFSIELADAFSSDQSAAPVEETSQSYRCRIPTVGGCHPKRP